MVTEAESGVQTGHGDDGSPSYEAGERSLRQLARRRSDKAVNATGILVHHAHTCDDSGTEAERELPASLPKDTLVHSLNCPGALT